MERVLTSTKRFGFLFLAFGLLLGSSAQALTISGVTIAPAGSNTADNAVNGGSSSNNTSAVSILTPGGTIVDSVGASVGAEGRYASNLWSDASFTGVNAVTTNSYNLSLSVSADPGTFYDIAIVSLFQGVLVRDDDSFFGQSEASVSAVTVSINGSVSVPHSTSAQLLALGYYDATETFSEIGFSSLTGLTGITTLDFVVNWTSTADNSEDDESAVLLGLDEAGGPVSGVSAGEYGNLPSARDRNLDGHFINVSATVTAIPEPGTLVLLGMGLVGLAAHRRRS
ncbi:MAG: PEP-CTERM sorting domain-containing protein [Myxococcota bacterium]|nr:PEP-CTERM sorting domain-containing protein [Myxococcota bacterium]